MAVTYQIFTKIIEKLKAQIPTLTEEDIISTLNIIYLSCVKYNDIADSVDYISLYYQKQYQTFDSQLFKKNLHYCFEFLDQNMLDNLRKLVHVISVNGIGAWVS